MAERIAPAKAILRASSSKSAATSCDGLGDISNCLSICIPKLSAFVTLDSRMSSSALYSDYVLPVTAWYERDEHKWNTPLMPFIHAGSKVSSYYEAKSDWEISALAGEKGPGTRQSAGHP